MVRHNSRDCHRTASACRKRPHCYRTCIPPAADASPHAACHGFTHPTHPVCSGRSWFQRLQTCTIDLRVRVPGARNCTRNCPLSGDRPRAARSFEQLPCRVLLVELNGRRRARRHAHGQRPHASRRSCCAVVRKPAAATRPPTDAAATTLRRELTSGGDSEGARRVAAALWHRRDVALHQ